MASTIQTPPRMPQPVPPPPAQRSLAGPIVLILLGICFLLGNMRVVGWPVLLHAFAHYWPLLLILWGLIKLFEYQNAAREGRRASGIGVGGVFLVIFVILLGLAATQAANVNWQALNDNIGWDDSNGFHNLEFFGSAYDYNDELSQAFPSGGILHVTSDRGNITIQASDDNQIRVLVTKKVHAESQQDADKYNLETKPQISVSGTIVTLNANTHGAGDHGVATNMTISIPRQAQAVAATHHGDITINGRDADVEIDSHHGEVTTAGIQGRVSVKLDHSAARISQVSSDVSIEGRADDVAVEDIKGSVRLIGEFMENVKLAKIAKSVIFKSSRTDMEFTQLDGDLEFDSGDLTASSVVGPLRLITRSKDIHLTGVSGDVRVQDQNGGVEVHVAKMGSMQIDNRKGDVQIYLPEKAGFQLDARTRNGEIQSDYSELKVNNENDQGMVSGTIGSGGPHVVLNNEHGEIEIRKSSAVAEVPPVPKLPKPPAPSKTPNVTEN